MSQIRVRRRRRKGLGQDRAQHERADRRGRVRGYVGQGEFTDDPFNMKGGIAVCEVPDLQKLLKHICKQGFEHHCAMVRSHCAEVIREAVTTYLDWDLYVHE